MIRIENEGNEDRRAVYFLHGEQIATVKNPTVWANVGEKVRLAGVLYQVKNCIADEEARVAEYHVTK